MLLLRINVPLTEEENIAPMTNVSASNAASLAAAEAGIQPQAALVNSEITQETLPSDSAMPPSTMHSPESGGQLQDTQLVNREPDQGKELENDVAARVGFVQAFQLEESSEEDSRAFTGALIAFHSHLQQQGCKLKTANRYTQAIRLLFRKHRRPLDAMTTEAYRQLVKSSDFADKLGKMAALRHLCGFVGVGAKGNPRKRNLAKAASTGRKPQKPRSKSFGPRSTPTRRRLASIRAAVSLRRNPSVIQAREAAKALFAVNSNLSGGTQLFRKNVAILNVRVQNIPNQQHRARIQRALACMVETSQSSMNTPGNWRRFLPTVLFLLGMRRGEIDGLVEKHKLSLKRIRSAKWSLFAMERKRRKMRDASNKGSGSATRPSSAGVQAW